jgi:hypothetical protein
LKARGAFVLAVALTMCFATVPVIGQSVVRSIPAPGPESRGLAWDGNSLWLVDSEVGMIYQVDPVDGTVLHSFEYYTDFRYGGLTWSADGNLWQANGAAIYLLEPTTGDIKYVLPCPGG